MLELFQQYDISTIIIFIILLAIAIKEVFNFFDWASLRIKKHFNKDMKIKDEHKKIFQDIDEHTKQIQLLIENQQKLETSLNQVQASIDLLIESDKDDIKSWITDKHHYFCYQKKSIDDYSLQCIEKRYENYIKENGNSFVADLMNEIRKLPVSIINVEKASTNIEN